MERRTRRRVLRLSGTALVAGLAGCGIPGGGGGEEGGEEGGGEEGGGEGGEGGGEGDDDIEAAVGGPGPRSSATRPGDNDGP